MRVKPVDIREVWDSIEPKIKSIKNRYKHDWRTEDVYAACLTGKSFIYVHDDNFIIVHDRINEYTLKTELFVWLVWSNGQDSLDEYFDDVCAIAKSVKAEKIKFSTQRKGYEKHAKSKGWKLESIIYEIEVP